MATASPAALCVTQRFEQTLNEANDPGRESPYGYFLICKRR